MKNNKHLVFIITIVLCMIAATAVAGSLKERMKQRAPAIAAIKAEGIVGENWAGFIEFRGAPQQEDLVRAENSDRKTVYTAIARKRGVSIEEVGKMRSEIIAQKAPKGTWLQNPDKSWYKK